MRIQPIWIFTLGIIAWLTLPLLVQDGMFMDGTLYTAVAKNLSEGLGTFWSPHFSATWGAGSEGAGPFREHPPLAFAIQSVFFKILGPSIYTERIYIFLCLILQSLCMLLIWRKLLPASFQSKGKGWLPMLLWFSIPLVFWGFNHNIHENTMAIFILLSSYLAIVAMQKTTLGVFPLVLSGLFIVGASLCKGVPAFFPIVIPFCYWLVFDRSQWKKMLQASFLLLGTLVAAFVLLYQYAPAAEALDFYVEKRLLMRIAVAPTVDNRLSIIWRAFTELIPALLIMAGLVGLVQKKLPSKPHRQWALFFALIGLAGIAPLALTKVQRGFYMNPALPFMALSLACLCLPAIGDLYKKWQGTKKGIPVFTIFSCLLLVSALAFTISKIGDTKRHHKELHDVHLIGSLIPEGSVLSTDKDVLGSGALLTYLARHYHIAIGPDNTERLYSIYPIDKDINMEKRQLEKINGDFQMVQLYKRK